MVQMELRCPRDLALRLGAIEPRGFAHHRVLRKNDLHLLMRDERGWALFWQWQLSPADEAAARSS